MSFSLSKLRLNDKSNAMQLAFLLAIVCFAAYVPVLDFGFFVDDDVYVGSRNRVLPSLDIGSLWRLIAEKGNDWEYLPFRDFSYWLDMRLLGYDPLAFHASNLIWYVFCCYAIFRFARELFLLYSGESVESARFLGSLATLLFLVHPAHVEVVAWISGRKDILATAFFAYGGSYYLSGIRLNWSVKRLAIACALCLIALFSKSVAVFCVPILSLVALDCRRTSRLGVVQLRFGLFLLAPFLLAVVAAIVHLQVALETGIGIDNSPGAVIALERGSRILASIVGIALFPYKLRLIYDVYAIGWWHWGLSLLCLLVLMGAVGAMFRGRKSILALSVVLLIVPLLSYLQFSSYVTWSLASERFVFQASLGVIVGLTGVLRRMPPAVSVWCCALVALASVLVLAPRVLQWQSSEVLRRHDFAINPSHHSAVRELVIGHLLPGRKYSEAMAATTSIYDEQAKTLLQRLIGLENLSWHAQKLSFDTEALRDSPLFCNEAMRLDRDLRLVQIEHSKVADLTYINYVGHLRAYLNHGLNGLVSTCRKSMRSSFAH